MSIADFLDEGRDFAEELLTDLGELREPDVRVFNETTGQYENTPGALVYSGKAKVQTTDTIGQGKEAGDRLIAVTRFEVHLPMSAAQAKVGHIWRTTESLDPQLVGKALRVASLIHKTHMTARRLAVEEVQS